MGKVTIWVDVVRHEGEVTKWPIVWTSAPAFPPGEGVQRVVVELEMAGMRGVVSSAWIENLAPKAEPK